MLNENTNAQIAAFGISGSPWYIAFGSATTSVMDASLPPISVYPNPATNEITIAGLTESCTATIYDMAGKRIQQCAAIAGKQKVNIADLNPGCYVLEITGEQSKMQKSIPFEKR